MKYNKYKIKYKEEEIIVLSVDLQSAIYITTFLRDYCETEVQVITQLINNEERLLYCKKEYLKYWQDKINEKMIRKSRGQNEQQ